MEIYIIVIIATALFSIFHSKIRGFIGEKNVSFILNRLPSNQYKTINDLMLNTEFGTSQIDHVVVSIYGIFVIETKNYKGWITGSEFGEQWTKNMYGNKYSFRNPIKQNYGHIKALEKKLGLDINNFMSIVVFSNAATLKVKTTTPVLYTHKLLKHIKSYDEVIFTEEKITEITKQLTEQNVNSRENKVEHVKQIRSHIKEDKQKISNKICPKCGGDLIKRSSKYGDFWGCSNYPKCKFTLKI